MYVQSVDDVYISLRNPGN